MQLEDNIGRRQSIIQQPHLNKFMIETNDLEESNSFQMNQIFPWERRESHFVFANEAKFVPERDNLDVAAERSFDD